MSLHEYKSLFMQVHNFHNHLDSCPHSYVGELCWSHTVEWTKPSLLTSWCRIEIHTNFQTKKGQSYFWVLLGACQHISHGMRVQMVEPLLCTLLQRNTVPVGIHALVGFTRLWMYKTEFIEFSYCCFLNIVAPSVRRKASKQLEH